MTPLDIAQEFDRRRYAAWPSLLDADSARRLHAYALMCASTGTMTPDEPNGALSAGGDFIMNGVLVDLAPRVEQATGIGVWPTYSFFRVYRCGDVLKKHTDRPACEISLTLCLGFVADAPWPICIEGPLGVSRVELYPGDALLYRGIECPHWRDRFDGETAAQVFLHYVDRTGPYAEWKFDKQPSLA